MAKINRCSPIKERVRRFGKRIDFLLFFFAARGARQESPLWGREEKFFIFFNVDMRLGRVFFPLKKMNASSCGVGEYTYFGLADSKNFS